MGRAESFRFSLDLAQGLLRIDDDDSRLDAIPKAPRKRLSSVGLEAKILCDRLSAIREPDKKIVMAKPIEEPPDD
jgi:hypothetical protein